MQYEILGDNLPVVVLSLQDGEKVVTQSGGMAWMSPNMRMNTSTRGGVGKAVGRLFSGDTLFQNIYTAHGEGSIAFASSFPGEIIPFQIEPGKGIIAQKSAFLASTEGVELSVHFQKKISSGFFGGEGFIMQRLSGAGTAFLEIDGYTHIVDLEPGERIVLSSGYLAAMDDTVDLDIQSVGEVKNMVFGGEGIFNTVLTGPGRVYIQSIPMSQFARTISKYTVTN